MKTLTGILLAVVAAPVFGQYTYYFTDPMQSLQTADWASSGSPTFTNANGYWGAYGASTTSWNAMLSTVAVQGGGSSYNIRATLRFPSYLSGQVSLLLRSNALTNGGGPTTAYVAQFLCGSGSGTLTVMKVLNSVTTTLSTGSFSCSDGMTIRSAINDSGQIISFVNDAFINLAQDSSPITSGAMGIVLNAYYANMLVTQIQLGAADRINPGPIPNGGLTYAVYSNHIDFQWQAVPDDPNGTGVCLYQFLKDDVFTVNTNSLSWSDTAVQPGVEYSYTFIVYDRFFNSISMNITIAVPPLPSSPPTPPDGHRIGVRSTGAYWGAATEQIDVLSGNINYTIPILKAVARTGWGVGFNLTYNSQNWRQDWAGLWNLGEDIGYGYGWKLLAGSLTPIYGDQATLAYYLYTDATGAEYRLNQNNGGVWTSLESIYVTYNSNTNQLFFRDGSFWTLGCTSQGSEPDFGTMYPTMMEDTNGNTITISYMPYAGGSGSNSSGRIYQISDVRTLGSPTYTFNYTNNRLTSITNRIQTSESYTFSYGNQLTLQSPFSGASTSYVVQLLETVGLTTNSQQYSLTYTSDNSGTLQNIVLPNGGQLTWAYQNVSYGNGATFQEVTSRQLSTDGSTFTTYPFTYGSPGYNANASTLITDPGGVGEKFWTFSQSGANAGMVTEYQGLQLPGPVVKTQSNLTWTQDNVGNLYIGSTVTTLDPGQGYQAQKRTDQVVDVYGNVLKTLQYDYNNLSAPARIYTYTYLNSSAYTARYIYNRLTQATEAIGSQNVITIATNTYDATALQQPPAGVSNWDNTYASVTTRGDVTSWTKLTDTGSMTYDQAGNVVTAVQDGVTTQVSTNSASFYAAPSQLSIGGITTSIDYSSFMGITSVTGANSGDTSSISYDSSARPSQTISPYTAVTNYTYTNYSPGNPATTKATVNPYNGVPRWTLTTVDGLGRTTSVQTGDSSGALSQTDTQYAPCACSPTGKMKQQSMAHSPTLPEAQWIWTKYTYDGIGRTVSVLAPDGASTTTYIYQGNTVKVVDPAGKWKIFTMDAFGHLTTVDEPNPAGGSTPQAPVAPPTFSLPPGSYYGSQVVTLSTTTSGATIYYTTNGSTPNQSSTQYTGAITLTNATTTINAIAYASGMAASAVSTGTYTLSSGSGGGPAWYNPSWSYRKQITISASQVAGSLSSFPVLIFIPYDSNLANGGAQSNGNDILFTDSSGTKLSHEIETFVSSTGKLVAWVNVASLSPTSNTVIYMYYGNSSAGNQQNPSAVWDSNFLGVWHEGLGTSTQYSDSTSHNNTLTPIGTPTSTSSGEIGSALNYTASSQYSGTGATSGVLGNSSNSRTVSFWFNFDSFLSSDNNPQWFMGNSYNDDGNYSAFGLQYQLPGNTVSAFWSNGTNGGHYTTSSTSALSAGTWYFATVEYDSNPSTMSFYLNGSLVGSTSVTADPISGSYDNLLVGYLNSRYTNIEADEIRESNIARSAAWITTEYNNQSSPGTFFSLSSQQSQNGGGGTGGAWYDGAWSFRKPITITGSQVAGSLTDFPVLVLENSDSNLSTYAQSTGNDILFTAGDGITKLNHEIETYTSSNGQLVAWVQLPALSSGSNTTIYMYYGNPAASNQQSATSVWDSNFVGVWHFDSGGSGLNTNDSTWNVNNGTNNSATAATGQIGGGANFNGSSGYVALGDTNSLQVDGLVTFSAWANVASFPPVNTNNWAYIVGKGYDNTNEGFFFRLNAQSSTIQLNAGSFENPNNFQVLWPISGWNTNTWHHVVTTYDGTAWHLYMDGVLEASANQTTGAIPSNPGVFLGAQDINGSMQRFWNGSLDEVRISNIARSAAWITTEYNNQKSPGNFLSFGSPQSLTGGSYYPPTVALPTLDPAPGMYSAPVNVVLSTTTPGATIYYTTDGSTPNPNSSPIYAAPIPVNASMTVNAIAIAPGMATSEMSSGSYTITSLGSGGDYMTYYTYDAWDNLATVTMPRPTGTQTRSFTYSGKLLISATNPENGTVTYCYSACQGALAQFNNPYNKLAVKTDAKGQQTVYTYDTIARLIEVQKYPSGVSGSEDTCQRELYYYDANPWNGNYTSTAIGRLAAIQYYAPASGNANSGCGTTVQEQYNYHPAGAKINKGLLITRTLHWGSNSSGPFTADLESSYTYDNEGRMLSVQYPGSTNGSGPSLSYTYDTQGRLNTMTDVGASTSLISSTSYDYASKLTGITGAWYNEQRSYNSMEQMTWLTNNSVNVNYYYSSTQNNGKITGQKDNVSGEQVVYTYDALNRLASAATTAGTSWGQSYTYDGFGNLLDQTTTAGSPPGLSTTYNASTNQQPNDCADANGNINSQAATSFACNSSTEYAYDVKNRIVWVPGNTAYAYAPGNKRVWRGTTANGQLSLDEITFWSVTGQKLATYAVSGDPAVVYGSQPTLTVTIATANYYYGRKLIRNGGWVNGQESGFVGTDRLGSVGSYHFYPWGQEKPSATLQGTEKFTGYFRDAETNNDYALNRYHQPGMGRFLSPDPYMASDGPSNPGSWNRYAYVLGDPINFTDHRGLYVDCTTDDCDESGGGAIYMSAQYCIDNPDVCVAADEGSAGGGGFCEAGNQFYNSETGSCEDDNEAGEDSTQCDAQFLVQGIGGFSASDINLAARVVFGESSGNYNEDVDIADVIVNRLNNPLFSGGTLTTLTQVVTVPRQFNAITPPGPNWPFTNSAPGLYENLDPTDCNNLKTAIAAMAFVAGLGPTTNYNSFGAAGSHSGTVVGGSVFWTQSPPQKTRRPRRHKKPHL